MVSENLNDFTYGSLEDKSRRKLSILRSPFSRQIFICSGVWTSYFILGLLLGAPTVLIPQIRREANSTSAISENMASWLSSISCYGGIPWVFILPFLARLYGRKVPYMVVCVTNFIGYIIFYYSNSLTFILISEIIQGVNMGSQITISIMVLSEYTSPKYRGIFMTLKSATFFWGIWASNAIGTFYHWKNIGIFGVVCSVYTLFSVLFCPESPYWLASNGRFRECTQAHIWLKGNDNNAKLDLESLIKSQKESMKNPQQISLIKEGVSSLKQIISNKELYKPILLCILVLSLYHFSGKLVCSVYAIDIIKKVTDNELIAYVGMLVLDGITVFGMYMGCILSRFLKRRTLLLISSSVGITFLFIFSLYLYLIRLSIIVENKYLSITLLTCFSLSISCGPIIMATSLCGELLPLKSRSTSVCIVALFAITLMGTMLKISPFIFATFHLYGAFLFYGLTSLVFLVLVFKYLPETKDKTLQEIEMLMQNYTNEIENERVITEHILI